MNSEKPTPTPASQDHRRAPSEMRHPDGFGPLVKVLVVVLVIASVLAVFRGAISRLINGRNVGAQVGSARDAVSRQDWAEAATHIRAAREAAPNDPALLRVTTEYLDKTGMEPALQLQILLTLREAGLAHHADVLLEGRAHLRNGDVALARAAYASLPADIQTASAALELKAAILAQEGEKQKAHAARQLAVARSSDEPEAAFRRAAAALKSSVGEARETALAELWAMSSGADASALSALRLLVERADLTPAKAETLLQSFEKHPDHDQADRLSAISALMRITPSRRAELLDQEVPPDAERSLEDTLTLARWLAHEKEHARVMKLVPRDTLLESKELFPIVLQSMAEAGRWNEMRELFEKHRVLPMKDEGIQVWKALAASRLDPTLKQAEHHLRLALTGSISGKNHGTLRAAAQVAEDLKLWELAFEGYSRLSSPELGHELEMLDKCWNIAITLGDLPHQLATARRQSSLRPTSAHFANRLDYLRLLLGDEIEATVASRKNPVEGDIDDAPLATLLRALKAYRLGDPRLLADAVTSIRDASVLTPGQRAVCAGLLAAAGETSRAFQLAERISPQALAPQEKAFLQKAL